MVPTIFQTLLSFCFLALKIQWSSQVPMDRYTQINSFRESQAETDGYNHIIEREQSPSPWAQWIDSILNEPFNEEELANLLDDSELERAHDWWVSYLRSPSRSEGAPEPHTVQSTNNNMVQASDAESSNRHMNMAQVGLSRTLERNEDGHSAWIHKQLSQDKFFSENIRVKIQEALSKFTEYNGYQPAKLMSLFHELYVINKHILSLFEIRISPGSESYETGQLDMTTWVVKQMLKPKKHQPVLGFGNQVQDVTAPTFGKLQGKIFNFIAQPLVNGELEVTAPSNLVLHMPVERLQAGKLALEVLANYYQKTNHDKWNKFFGSGQSFLEIVGGRKTDRRRKKNLLKDLKQKISNMPVIPWSAN